MTSYQTISSHSAAHGGVMTGSEYRASARCRNRAAKLTVVLLGSLGSSPETLAKQSTHPTTNQSTNQPTNQLHLPNPNPNPHSPAKHRSCSAASIRIRPQSRLNATRFVSSGDTHSNSSSAAAEPGGCAAMASWP